VVLLTEVCGGRIWKEHRKPLVTFSLGLPWAKKESLSTPFHRHKSSSPIFKVGILLYSKLLSSAIYIKYGSFHNTPSVHVDRSHLSQNPSTMTPWASTLVAHHRMISPDSPPAVACSAHSLYSTPSKMKGKTQGEDRALQKKRAPNVEKSMGPLIMGSTWEHERLL